MVNVLMSRSEALVSKYAYEHLTKIIKPKMKAVVLGFSFFNPMDEKEYSEYYGLNSEYYLKIKANFNIYGVTEVNWIYYYNQNLEMMIKLINEADILYLPGGAPDLMMARIKEKGILAALKNFKGIVIGSSAGAMIQLKYYHISPDNEYKVFSEHEGLGYLNEFFIEVHYARRKKQKQGMRKIRRRHLKPIYIIPDDGMIIKEGNQILTLNTAKKYYNKKGIER